MWGGGKNNIAVMIRTTITNIITTITELVNHNSRVWGGEKTSITVDNNNKHHNNNNHHNNNRRGCLESTRESATTTSGSTT